MTGSKKVLTLMNHYRHCESSEIAQRIDISLESTLITRIASYLTVSKPILIYREDTAWDNFNINLETPSGANTIHHTYVICYQTIKEKDEIETEESLKIHVNLNQLPNQLQRESMTPKSNKRKLSRFSKVTPPPDNEL